MKRGGGRHFDARLASRDAQSRGTCATAEARLGRSLPPSFGAFLKQRMLSLPLLEQRTIAVVAVLLVAGLVGVIKYDIHLTAASQPANRTGMNSAPIRGAQLKPVSACPAAVTPTFTVADLLGRVTRFQLAQRVVD
jgi:hypothetical protein